MRTSPRYEVRVRGLVGRTVLEAFPTLESYRVGGDTALTGSIADQAALFGVLLSIEALGLELLELRVCDEVIATRNPSDVQSIPGGLLAMNVTHGFHATMTAVPGKGDELIDFLLSAAAGEGPGTNENCVLFLVGRSRSDPDTVFLTEGWTSKEAHERFFASHEAKAVLGGMQDMLAGEAEYLDEVPVGGKLPIG